MASRVSTSLLVLAKVDPHTKPQNKREMKLNKAAAFVETLAEASARLTLSVSQY